MELYDACMDADTSFRIISRSIRGPSHQGKPADSQSIPNRRPLPTDIDMVGHQELRILQYNVRKSRDFVLASLFQKSEVLDYDILAIQEPWRNPFIETSYHPLKTHFQLSYLADSGTRVYFISAKELTQLIRAYHSSPEI